MRNIELREHEAHARLFSLVGAAVGAGTGALTDKNRIDLGKPFWR